jgi:sRNA-binding carbon storage regulator CsrA
VHRFTCQAGDGVVISGVVTVTVTRIEGEQASLLITAPASVGVVDAALYERALAAWEARLAQDQQHEPFHLRH